MRKLKAIAFSIAAAFVLVAAPSAYVAADQSNPQLDPSTKIDAKGLPALLAPTCNPRLSAANADSQEIFLSTSNPWTYSGTAWQNVSCTNTTFKLKYGQRALITSEFSAEADCNGGTNQWCKTRALLSGSEGTPLAPEGDSFAFDSANGGSANWQAHTMTRAWVRQCLLLNGCTYNFVVQTQMRDATSSMWLDEVTARLNVTVGQNAPL